MTPTPQENSWEKKFDKRFGWLINVDPSVGDSSLQTEIKSFISTLLRETENDLMAAIEAVSPMSIKACNCCGGAIENHWRGLHYEIAEHRSKNPPPNPPN